MAIKAWLILRQGPMTTDQEWYVNQVLNSLVLDNQKVITHINPDTRGSMSSCHSLDIVFALTALLRYAKERGIVIDSEQDETGHLSFHDGEGYEGWFVYAKTLDKKSPLEYIFVCSCGQQMRVQKQHIGLSGKCVGCGKPVVISHETLRPYPQQKPLQQNPKQFHVVSTSTITLSPGRGFDIQIILAQKNVMETQRKALRELKNIPDHIARRFFASIGIENPWQMPNHKVDHVFSNIRSDALNGPFEGKLLYLAIQPDSSQQNQEALYVVHNNNKGWISELVVCLLHDGSFLGYNHHGDIGKKLGINIDMLHTL